jgi:hypothetical protein
VYVCMRVRVGGWVWQRSEHTARQQLEECEEQRSLERDAAQQQRRGAEQSTKELRYASSFSA